MLQMRRPVNKLFKQPPKGSPSPQVSGVRIAVYNGTSVTGLASDTAKKLQDTY